MQQEPAAISFQVHLAALTTFARQLEHQLDAVTRPASALAQLGGPPLPLGGFAEAAALDRQHDAAAAQLLELVQAVRDALGFASEVTGAVAAGYRRSDQAVADAYLALTGAHRPQTGGGG